MQKGESLRNTPIVRGNTTGLSGNSPDDAGQSGDLAKDERPISGWAWIGLFILLVAACLHGANKSIGGGDTWVAMACGRYTLGPWAQDQPNRTWQMHLLDKIGIHATKHDPFGGTSRKFVPTADDPTGIKSGKVGWVNQNWLTHVLFYKMKTAFGGNELGPQKGEVLIVIYKFLQAILTGLFAYWGARVLGAHPILAAATASFGMLLSRSYIDLRPNMSSIFFAAIMIMILNLWRKKRYRALWWMIPVTIIWSNVHGGFIYAIMVFAMVVGAYFVQILMLSLWRDHLVQVSWKGWRWLLITAVAVAIIPGVFSPFGWENLEHPFIVAAGNDGKVWREVIEWRPIWDTGGFGNATPYIVYLSIFAVVFLTWWTLFFCKPALPPSRRRRQKRTRAEMPWPRVDLAQLGIMAITIYMSIVSRRFIFLGGVVLAPFLAQMVQEIINMCRIRRAHQQELPLRLAPLSRRLAWSLAGLSVLAGAAMTAVFAWCMWDVYYRPPFDGSDYSVFRRMVGIPAQPVRAIKFFDLNNLKGIVFNEWVNGGFIAFHQTPKPATGEPSCKVFIDGRAQAAYELDHFQRWKKLHFTLPKPPPPARRRTLEKLQQFGNMLGVKAPLGTAKFFDELVTKARKDPQIYPQLGNLVPISPELYVTLLQKDVEAFARNQRLDPHDPNTYDKLVRLAEANYKDGDPALYEQLLRYVPGKPLLFDRMLTYQGATAALVFLQKSRGISESLAMSGNWVMVYNDGTNAILLRKDAPENREILDKPAMEIEYPDEFSKKISIGYYLCRRHEPTAKQQGIDILMALEEGRFAYGVYDTIFGTGLAVNKPELLVEYFSRQRQIYKAKIDAGEDFARAHNHQAVLECCEKLAKLARLAKKPTEVDKYTEEWRRYNKGLVKVMEEINSRFFWGSG